MKKEVIMVLVVLVLMVSGMVHGAIPAQERAALIALYNSTNGDNWSHKSGWKTSPLDADGFALPGTEANWHGVTLTGDHVTTLELYNNNLSGSIPSEIGNFSSLQYLLMSHNQLAGAIPAETGNLVNLLQINVTDNQLSGSIPPELGNLNQLTHLSLSYNQLSGSISPQLGSLSNLEYLLIDHCQMSGTIPQELGNLSKLVYLDLEHNQLTGSIPPQLGNLNQLSWFNLRDNKLTGSIPSQLGNLNRLDTLNLSFNHLTGSIPLQLGNLNNLAQLILYGNLLTGSIPKEIGNLTKLQYLNLSRNNLSGSIPSELCNLWTLYELYLFDNQLSGTIPTNLKTLSYLYVLDIGYNCLTATDPELRTWLNTLDPDWEINQNQCGSPEMGLSATSLYFGATISGTYTGTQNITIDNTGNGDLYWNATSGTYWLIITPAFGTNSGTISVSVDPTGLTTGTHTGTITVTAPNTQNSPQTVSITLTVYQNGAQPFGTFETPLDGVTVQSSIAVTGWILDDIGVSSVKIYRSEGNGLAYIGDAVFVEGARPDVATAYPGYPNNTKAGWGYMMLTNFLPNGGNGTYTIHAIATDYEGNQTTLGTKTIPIDNAHAVKPFGAIDTPAQGGIASGNRYINWGWALTPQPNHIPTDGSTIQVWIDGAPIGNPVYNGYRSDIVTLFPGYANTDGAIGYYYINTTNYTNGVHTIAWSVTDSGDNTDGIGSRYFSIQNESYDTMQMDSTVSSGNGSQRMTMSELSQIQADPEQSHMPKRVIKEMQRVHFSVSKDLSGISEISQIQGYVMANNELMPLPIGSTLDQKEGTFSWIPGPGFLGTYSLVFVITDSNGQTFKKTVKIEIVPKFR